MLLDELLSDTGRKMQASSDESECIPLAYFVLVGMQETSQEKKGVTISTIHGAKGLEWDAVFVLRQNEGFLPSAAYPDTDTVVRVTDDLKYKDCFEVLKAFDGPRDTWPHDPVRLTTGGGKLS